MVNWVQNKTFDCTVFASYLEDTRRTNAFTNSGPTMKRLESEIKRRLGIGEDKAVVATSSGTAALWAAKGALDLSASRRLRFATQAFTFPSSAEGYMSDSAIVDIDEGGGLSLASLESMKDDVDGIVVTNVFGCVVDIDKYTGWARDNNKVLLFDNAATPLTFYRGKNSLNYGDVAICSLHHTKTIGFGEGGFVVCNLSLEPFVRRAINFGIDNNAATPEWSRFGGNYKMSDIAAAAILQFWESDFDGAIARTREVREEFEEFEESFRGLRIFPSHHDEGTTPVHTCMPILVKDSSEILRTMNEAGIKARKYYSPLGKGHPNTDAVYAEIVCVPCHADVSRRDVSEIFKCFTAIPI